MKNVEDIYAATPMQELMLLHALANPLSDPLFNQFCFEIQHPVDVEAFEQAWQGIVNRHPALRTAFIWEDVPTPLQVVRKKVRVRLEELDWRELGARGQETAFSALLEEDRKSGLDFRRAPLMRFRLVRLGEESWRFVWTSHHLIVDRWCLGQIFSEFDLAYAAGQSDGFAETKQAQTSFRAYVDWLSRQDEDEARAYWASALRGCTGHSRIAPAKAARGEDGPDAAPSAEYSLSREKTHALAEYARKSGLTRSTLIHGAWALTLSKLLNLQDAVFGATVSGRPSDIPDVESIVGSFVNNVPVRIEMPGARKVGDWLNDIQTSRFGASRFEYLAPADIQRCAGLDDGDPLFDSLVVWLANVTAATSLPMRPMSFRYETPYPLTISIIDDPDSLTLRADSSRECLFPPDRILEELAGAIDTLTAAPSESLLSDLPGFSLDADYESRSAGPVSSPIPVLRNKRGSIPAEQKTCTGREALGTDVLRELLLAEWASLLGLVGIPDDADFFALGGSSLQAATLHARLEAATRQTIPMLTLFRTPTISGMASALFRKNWPVRPDILNGLRTAGNRVPLFCVASPEVNTVGYSLLTRYLPGQQRVYVLQSPPDSEHVRQIEPAALPELAALYIKAMRSAQPGGPYRLLGMCTGAHIALEMARQLELDGERVAFLGIVNTWAMYTISRLYFLNRSLNILRWYAQRLLELLPAPATKPAEIPQDVTDQESIVRQTVVSEAESVTGTGRAWIDDVGFAHKNPGRPKVHATATVFRQRRQQFWRIRDASLGWSKHTENVEIIPIPGNDQYMIFREPHVLDLASSLRECLEKCEGVAPLDTATH